MVDALECLAQNQPETPITHIEVFRLFVPGVAFDLISDMFCNIIKQELIAYTQDIAKRHNVPMTPVIVRGARWVKPGRWIDQEVLLPVNPDRSGDTSRPIGVILIPRHWLRKLRDPQEADFYHWTEYAVEAESLRSALNLDTYEELTKAEKARTIRDLTWKHPEVAQAFVDSQEGARSPCNIDEDPSRIFGYPEVGMQLFDYPPWTNSWRRPPTIPADGWARSRQFAHTVEAQDGWRALCERGTGKHVLEEATQAIANMFFRAHCDQKDVQVSREVKLGRRLVDFPFIRGRRFRALIEVKHLDNRRLVSGATGQLAQYLTSEQGTAATCCASASTRTTSGRAKAPRDPGWRRHASRRAPTSGTSGRYSWTRPRSSRPRRSSERRPPMPRYELIYSPKGPGLHVDMDTEVDADFYRVEGRFVTFYRNREGYEPADVILRVAATQVLPIKTLPEGND